ncbi:hypothetical protein SDC9_77917 [bioreactor metagenome]|uniref:Uncharacterized protein n=1 Tax=bioreactor metagenome TaxID=1076179 RepID=A0A644YRZ0_9ZZZZ
MIILDKACSGENAASIFHYLISAVPQSLDYLIFDYSEDEEGHATWDAMASAPAPRVAALASEVEQVLQWATRRFAGQRGALDDGGDWDFDLQAQDDDGTPLAAGFDAASGRLTLQASASGHTTVSLSISGNAQFAAAFGDAFHWDD